MAIELVSRVQANRFLNEVHVTAQRAGFTGKAAFAQVIGGVVEIRPDITAYGRGVADVRPIREDVPKIEIPKIELVTIREGLKMGKIMFTNGLYELMMKADPSLPKPVFWDDAEIGIAAGRDLPVVGIRAGWVDQILGSYNRLTGSNLVIPTIKELKEAANEVGIGTNKYNEVGQWTSDMNGNYRYFYFLRSGHSLNHPDYYAVSSVGLRVAERT